MQWNVYPESSLWAVGTALAIVRFLSDGEAPSFPIVDDSFVVEFPDHSRLRGRIINGTKALLIVDVEGVQWELVPSAAASLASTGKLVLHYEVRGTT